jgi:hypothetical protein
VARTLRLHPSAPVSRKESQLRQRAVAQPTASRTSLVASDLPNQPIVVIEDDQANCPRWWRLRWSRSSLMAHILECRSVLTRANRPRDRLDPVTGNLQSHDVITAELLGRRVSSRTVEVRPHTDQALAGPSRDGRDWVIVTFCVRHPCQGQFRRRPFRKE